MLRVPLLNREHGIGPIERLALLRRVGSRRIRWPGRAPGTGENARRTHRGCRSACGSAARRCPTAWSRRRRRVRPRRTRRRRRVARDVARLQHRGSCPPAGRGEGAFPRPARLPARSADEAGRTETAKDVKPVPPGRPHFPIVLPKRLLQVKEVHLVTQEAKGIPHVPHPRAGAGGARMGRHGRDQEDLPLVCALSGIQTGPSGD